MHFFVKILSLQANPRNMALDQWVFVDHNHHPNIFYKKKEQDHSIN